MKYLFKNNASGTLSAAITSLATSLTLDVGQGVNFPNPTTNQGFIATLQVGSDIEIVEVTQRSGDVFTITRAREGTLARAWPIGTPVEMRVTAGLMATFFQLFAEVVDFGKTLALGTGGKITGGTIESTTLTTPLINNPDLRTGSVKPVDGDVSNAIVLPNGGGMPTIGGAAIVTTEGSSDFSGPLETSGPVRGVTGTFGSQVFKTGTTVNGSVSMDTTAWLTDVVADVDIIWKTAGVERLHLEQSSRYLGIGVAAPLAAIHFYKNAAEALALRLENATRHLQLIMTAEGKTELAAEAAEIKITQGGFDRFNIDTAGRLVAGASGNGNATGTRFVATGDPTGGADGDIWLKV